MVYRTYKDWVTKGRIVKKGEKAVGFLTSGDALFEKSQTVKIESQVKHTQDTPDSWYMGDAYDYY